MSIGEYYVLSPTHEYEYYVAITIHEMSTMFLLLFTL